MRDFLATSGSSGDGVSEPSPVSFLSLTLTVTACVSDKAPSDTFTVTE